MVRYDRVIGWAISMYLLNLDVNPQGWRQFIQRKQDRHFVAFSQKVLHRDNFTCQFCGLQIKQYQEVINLDKNYFNNKFSNLVTACRFCTQCFFLESVASYAGGVLIYLPEITQNHLNAFCHLLFSAMNSETEYKETAQNTYRHFKLRSQVIEDELGEQMQDPSVFGQLLIESDERGVLKNRTIFQSIRLLPSRAGSRYQPMDWLSLIQKKPNG